MTQQVVTSSGDVWTIEQAGTSFRILDQRGKAVARFKDPMALACHLALILADNHRLRGLVGELRGQLEVARARE